VPVAIKGRNVEEIINEWNSELEKQSQAFVKHAAALAAWDRHILSNRHSLLEVEEDLKKVSAGQEALERKLYLLETHQKEIHDALSSIEVEAERMCVAERGLLDADAAERDRLYARAEAASAALMGLGNELHVTVTNVNELSAASMGDPSNPLTAVVRILNNQLQALTQIEGRIGELTSELERMSVAAR